MDNPSSTDSPGSYVLYLCPDSGSSSSISTNATAPNLPGPGRTIGLAYDALGSALERQLRRFAKLNNQVPSLSASESESSLRTTSTATASNNPGTGRVIGLAYDAVGRVLEKRLNWLACKFGLGPEEVARKIDTWHSRVGDKYIERTGDPRYRDLEHKVLETDIKRIKNLCRALVKYVHSDVHSNRLCALELILELSVKQPYFRQVFEDLGAGAIIGTIYYRNRNYADFAATLTVNSSRKALIVVSEVKINSLVDELWRMSRHSPYRAKFGERACSLLHELLQYGSNNADVSFLLFRHLARISWVLSSYIKSIKWNGYLLDVATLAVSRHIENIVGNGATVEDWVELDHLIRSILRFWIFPRSTLACEYHRPYLRIILRFPDKLPSSIAYLKSTVENSWKPASLPMTGQMRMFMAWSIVQLPIKFVDLALIDLSTVKRAVENHDNPVISDLLDNITSLPFLLLRQTLLEMYPFSNTKKIAHLSDYHSMEWHDILKVPLVERIQDICSRLLYFYQGSDEKCQADALNCLRGLSRSNRYFDEVIQRLSPQSEPLKNSRVRKSYRTPNRWKCFIYRHEHKTDHSKRLFTNFDFAPVSSAEVVLSALEFGPSDIMWLEVGPHATFNSAGHYPFLVSEDVFGKREYVAGVSFRSDKYVSWKTIKLCTVLEGGRTVTYLKKGRAKVSDHFYVPVLRWEPHSYRKRIQFVQVT